MKNESKVIIQIKGIELVDFTMNQLKQILPPQTTFHFNINLEQLINSESKLVIVVATVVILHEDKTTVMASIKASCVFEVANLDEFISEDSRQVVFPESAVITFNSMTISTVRGLMFSQFKGTYLHNAILPVIDPSSFMKN
jgi:preprotein translocase subunit SecB